MENLDNDIERAFLNLHENNTNIVNEASSFLINFVNENPLQFFNISLSLLRPDAQPTLLATVLTIINKFIQLSPDKTQFLNPTFHFFSHPNEIVRNSAINLFCSISSSIFLEMHSSEPIELILKAMNSNDSPIFLCSCINFFLNICSFFQSISTSEIFPIIPNVIQSFINLLFQTSDISLLFSLISFFSKHIDLLYLYTETAEQFSQVEFCLIEHLSQTQSINISLFLSSSSKRARIIYLSI